MSGPVRLRLPATSANLGPGFDTAALALDLWLEVDAVPAESFSLRASGRNAEICAALEDNLLLETYRSILAAQGMAAPPLAIEMRNGIPLGMGCGSSAAVLLAGVALASHFGGLGWDRNRILAEATRIEGHPDNTAACWQGGFTVAVTDGNGAVYAATIEPQAPWRALLVLPARPLATTAARAVLPESYSRADAVANIQRVALLTAAFTQGRGDWLAVAMQDRIHQPYRGEICRLLPALLPLEQHDGILGVALSGAGPSVLVLVASSAEVPAARARILERTRNLEPVEIIESGLQVEGASVLPMESKLESSAVR